MERERGHKQENGIE